LLLAGGLALDGEGGQQMVLHMKKKTKENPLVVENAQDSHQDPQTNMISARIGIHMHIIYIIGA